MAASVDSGAHGAVDAFVSKGIATAILDCEVDIKLLCTTCKLLPRNPVQGFCGHRFCNDCIGDQLASSEDSVLCQGCVSENLVSEESTLSKNTIFPDAACRRELNQLPVHCCYGSCDWRGSFKDFEKHCESCLWFPVRCPICQDMIPRSQRDDHVTGHQRVSELRVDQGDMCPFGCDQQIGDEGLRQHVRDQLSIHLKSVFQRLEVIESELRHERHPESVVALMDQLERRLFELESSFVSSEALTTSGAASAHVIGSDEIATELDVFEKVLQVLSGEMSKLQELMKKSDEYKQQQKSKMDSLQNRASAMERAVSESDVRLNSIELRLTDVELTSYDGSLLWKVTDVGQRRQQAVTGDAVSVQSPAFYTSRTGYKLFGRVFLNGDGTGKGTHMSLFIVVARGTFDALQRWPFNQRVTMTLLDQVNNGRQNITESFRPDRASSAFPRPTTDANVPTGFPKFVPLTSFDNPQNVYIRDGAMFIRITVDCRDIL